MVRKKEPWLAGMQACVSRLWKILYICAEFHVLITDPLIIASKIDTKYVNTLKVKKDRNFLL